MRCVEDANDSIVLTSNPEKTIESYHGNIDEYDTTFNIKYDDINDKFIFTKLDNKVVNPLILNLEKYKFYQTELDNLDKQIVFTQNFINNKTRSILEYTYENSENDYNINKKGIAGSTLEINWVLNYEDFYNPLIVVLI